MLYIFTALGEMLGLAIELARQKYPVVLAIVEDLSTLNAHGVTPMPKPEKESSRRKRLAMGDGLVPKMSAREAVLKILRSPKKSKIRVLFDMNYLFRYAEVLRDTEVEGNFPSAWDAQMELDRNIAKAFVRDYYPYISPARVEEFKKIEDAIDFIASSESVWVVKPNSQNASTFVPRSSHTDIARQEVEGALRENKDEYEAEGFILEEKVMNVLEITPERLYLNGELVWETVCIETKELGAGGVGPIVGCSQDLVFRSDELGRQALRFIRSVAFPPIVDEMARGRKGIFLWDASLLIDPKEGNVYFGEFCPNRFGYNTLYTEIQLSGLEAADFVDALFAGDIDMERGYSASVRIFGTDREDDGSFSEVSGVIPIDHGYFWMSIRKSQRDIIVSDVGDKSSVALDVGVVTGSGATVEEAAYNTYDRVRRVSFPGMLYRPLSDFLGDHPKSPLSRHKRFIEFVKTWRQEEQRL